jgi:predicted HicB family RNase H-like nuclease
MSPTKPVFLRVDPDLWHSAKVQAVKEKQSLREFVIKAIQDKLNSKSPEVK